MNDTTNRPSPTPAWVPLPAAPTAGNGGSTAVRESGPVPKDDATGTTAPPRRPWRIPTDPPPV
jgi:hypothetical protein